MRKVWLTAIILVVFFIGYWFFLRKPDTADEAQSITSQQPMKIGAHSLAFNNSIDTLLSAYFALKNNFVDADSIAAAASATKLAGLTDSVKMDELKKDTSANATTLYATAVSQLVDVKTNAQSIPTEKTITAMRKDFQSVTESLYPLLKMIHYEGSILYLQNCPMAFGDGNDANWISNTAEIMNPYLGKKDITMYHCGETKDSIVGL
ncbi:MAG TPA: DUF3347 domain-containing protein [Ferruginibacter sp.]|nr:DUF3347 domain-containing protein [Ferruginibacter sp.]